MCEVFGTEVFIAHPQHLTLCNVQQRRNLGEFSE
jgi:hypothetical protein